MRIKKKYPGLNLVLVALKIQAIDSLHFARSFLPEKKMTPEEIFDFLKKEVVYYNDPKDIELLQSMPTLFGWENIHSIYGAGDCDCFTITALACLHTKGYKNLKLILAGRDPNNPCHVYANVNNTPFDLTTTAAGTERKYPYKQELIFTFKHINVNKFTDLLKNQY